MENCKKRRFEDAPPLYPVMANCGVEILSKPHVTIELLAQAAQPNKIIPEVTTKHAYSPDANADVCAFAAGGIPRRLR